MLVPLIWAAFFAVPLCGLISHIDHAVTSWLALMRWAMRPDGVKVPEEGVEFTAQAGENRISVKNGEAATALRQKLEHPCQSCCCLPASRCCQSRIRITNVTEAGEQIRGSEVNRIVANWLYYVREVPSLTVDAPTVELELFLDQEFHYPAVVSRTSTKASRKLAGTIELDRTSVLSWSFAVFLALALLVAGVYIFALATIMGVQAFQRNTANYGRGLEELTVWSTEHLKNWVPGVEIQSLRAKVIEFVKTGLPSAAAGVATGIESIGFQALLFLIYTMFWIFEPIPMNSNVAQVIKNYLLLKTFVCLVFAALISALLYFLSCPLWHIFFVLSFLLNYIPEIGFIIVFVLMLPAICLDAQLTMVERETNTVLLIVFSMLIKVVTANILEVQMYVSKGGQYMRMHPVVLMAMMIFFEKLLGLTGMFLAIPIAAAIKYYVLSADIPSVYLNPTLYMLEGDDVAPHKNFVDRHHAVYGSITESPSVESKV